jgi:hypothetical protein
MDKEHGPLLAPESSFEKDVRHAQANEGSVGGKEKKALRPTDATG